MRLQRLELFAGYSYAHTPLSAQGLTLCPDLVCPILASYSGTTNASGFEASAAFRFTTHWSAVANAGGTFGLTSQSSHTNAVSRDSERQYTYLVGPRISRPGHISPFAEALIGAVHQPQSITYVEFVDIGSNFIPFSVSQTSFAASFGGGLDLTLTSHIGMRVIQYRELLTRYNSSTQYQPEISAGILFHLR